MGKPKLELTPRHKSGPLKQQNKKHKTGRHRTKSQINKDKRGRTESVTSISSVSRTKKQLTKLAKRNRDKQKRQHRESLVLAEKEKLGGPSDIGAPILAVIVSLCDQSVAQGALRVLSIADQDAKIECSDRQTTYITIPRFKKRIGFFVPQDDNIFDILDAIKVADSLIFLWPLSGELSPEKETLMSCIFAQGLPATINVVQEISSLKGKAKDLAKKGTAKLLQKWTFEPKFHPIDSESDGMVILRHIALGKKHQLNLQKFRTYMIADSIDSQAENDRLCTLKIQGYTRGPPVDPNLLVHLVGWGDFQLSKIDILKDPRTLNQKKIRPNENFMETEDSEILSTLLPYPDSQQSLVSEATPDAMNAEQTWPSAEELSSTKIKGYKVPRGTSSYQAAWIIDENEGQQDIANPISESEDEEEECESENSDKDIGDETQKEKAPSSTERKVSFSTDVDMDYQRQILEREKFKKQRENEMYPDEVDFNVDTQARIRFQKYRGLSSFRTSPWDPKENLPPDYARIFQFLNFTRTRNRILDEAKKPKSAQQSSYVCIHVKNVPKNFIDSLDFSSPLIVFWLLPHEQQMSLVNVRIKKHHSCQQPIKSKDPLIFHMGCRRFTVSPVFSQLSRANKNKMERFLPQEDTVIASFYAPVTFPPCSAAVFRVDDGALQLVATGGVLDCNPDRIIVKRIILTGHPYRSHGRNAVVRFMFFNKDDIDWFKPVELRTKYGRRGHIVESLGTHGLMKCSFDAPVKSQDTVMLYLYKRVFPKWSYDQTAISVVCKDEEMEE